MNRPPAPAIALLIAAAGVSAAWVAQPSRGPGAGPAPPRQAAPGAPPPALRPDQRPTVRVRDCTTAGCHASETGHRLMHGPAAVNACDACHEPADVAAHTFDLKAEGRDLCTFCHINKAGGEGAFAHEPYARGECLSCHDPHGADVRFLLFHGGTNQMCLSCHEAALAGGAHVHAPITESSCLACHEAHAADHERLLPMAARDLCVSCHQPVQDHIAASPIGHEPVEGDCLQCHTPHASDTSRFLKAPPRELCVSCHEPVEQAALAATHPHSAVLEGDACLSCHQPHGSAHAGLVKDDPVASCLACHTEPEKPEPKPPAAPQGPVFRGDLKRAAAAEPAPPPAPERVAPPAADLAAGLPHRHGPVAEGRCAECHDVHGGSRADLLKHAYSTEFYQRFAAEHYALCFTCHDAALATAQPTLEATGFRDGDRNLHALHVNQEQGRSCRACHSPHASRSGAQIAETVPYGNWPLPINFVQTETGGSCAPGCHRPATYDRGGPPPAMPAAPPPPRTRATPAAGAPALPEGAGPKR